MKRIRGRILEYEGKEPPVLLQKKPYPGYENTETAWRNRMVEGIERIADRLSWVILTVLLIAGCVGWILLREGKW